MRLTAYHLFSFVITFLFLSNISFGQQTHTITLHVDTENLTLENVSADSISTFTADSTQIEVASPPEEFTVLVGDGSTVVWQAVSSSSPEDKVDIFMIKREKGPRILVSDEVMGNENGKASSVINKRLLNNPMKYQILFKVNGTGPVYVIDPKIKIGS
jgi:hypothetical protein